MANTPQATKRVRQNATRAEHNKMRVSEMRTAVKNFKRAVETGEGDKEALFNRANQLIDRTATHGLIHHNKATRLKKQLTKANQA